MIRWFRWIVAKLRGETGIQCWGVDGPCSSMNATRQRQNTAYVNDEQNWVVMCPECAAANEAYWDDMWRDYYAGRL